MMRIFTPSILMLIVMILMARRVSCSSESFDDYEVIQFIESSGPAPANILELDNNGEIFLACRGGKTRSELETMGISVSESQIQLMLAWRILDVQNDTLYPAIPILDPEKIGRLREITASTAPQISSSIQTEAKRLTRILNSMDRSDNLYAILFSYILDGMVWDRFIGEGLMTTGQLTADKPFWTGEVWAVCPARERSSGTNTLSDQGITMCICWSEAAIHKMKPFMDDWKNLIRIFDDYVEYGQVKDADARRVFAPFGLFSESGEFTIPVIEEQPGDQLFEASKAIAVKIRQQVPKAIDLSKLTRQFGFRDESQTLIIVYHELMWDIVENLVEQGIVGFPRPFINPEEGESNDIADLVFIVRRQ